MADVLKFVDSVASSPSVRLDLNDGTTWRALLNGSEFQTPPLRRALATTLMVDGSRQPAAAYDNRTIKLTLSLQATGNDNQATQIQNLAREVDRPQNVLMWQPVGATNAVFFKTLRSDVTRVVEHKSNRREVELNLMAEPFAYGLEQNLVAVTVNNDPANVSNGQFWDITGIKGDVETPAVISMPATAVYDATQRQSLIAVRRRGTPANMPFLAQAEAATQGTDTTTQANNAAYSGAGNNFSRCSFGTTSSNALRLTLPAPTDDKNLRGTYRLWMRYTKSVAGDPVLVQAKWDGAVYTNSQVTLASSTLFRWADLGLISMPAGPDPVYDGYSNVELAVGGRTVQIWAARSSGTTTLDFDYFLYVPADDNYLLTKWTSINDATYTAVVDGINQMSYVLNPSGNVVNLGANENVGGYPMLSPNQTNRLVFIRDVGQTSGATDAVTNTTSVTVSYFPRYLYVRPAST